MVKMRLLTLCLLITVFSCVLCRIIEKNTNSDTMGQEIIEIEGPKELPPGIEEEPSGGVDEEDDDLRSTTGSMTTKKTNVKKTTTVSDARKKLKDVEKIDGVSPEDEEARLEKELAEIYKDTDYKDSVEETTEAKETTTTTVTTTVNTITEEEVTTEEKPIGRQRNSFKFAPDSTNKKDVEKFRTSVDDINCKNRQKLSGSFTKSPETSGISNNNVASSLMIIMSFILISIGY